MDVSDLHRAALYNRLQALAEMLEDNLKGPWSFVSVAWEYPDDNPTLLMRISLGNRQFFKITFAEDK
jgi:hypothetical protein